MDYVTTTDLRSKSSQLIHALEKGTEVSLIHRSQVVAIIKPKKKSKIFTKKDIEDIKDLSQSAKLTKMSYTDRDKSYKQHLNQKYGKNLP